MLVGLDLPLVGRGTEAESDPHIRAVVWIRGETFKTESKTIDLWQPKLNENQTVLVALLHGPDKYAGPLEGTAAGSWSLGTVEQSQGEGCFWLLRDESRGCEGGDYGGMPVEESWAAMEARQYFWVMRTSLSPHASMGAEQ